MSDFDNNCYFLSDFLYDFLYDSFKNSKNSCLKDKTY